MVSIRLPRLGEISKMLHSIQKIQTEIASTGIDKVDRVKCRKMPPTQTERAKAFRDHHRAKQESACQSSTSNATTAADSLLELDVEVHSLIQIWMWMNQQIHRWSN